LGTVETAYCSAIATGAHQLQVGGFVSVVCVCVHGPWRRALGSSFRVVFSSPCFSRRCRCRLAGGVRCGWPCLAARVVCVCHRVGVFPVPPLRVVVKPYPLVLLAEITDRRTATFWVRCGGFPTRRAHGSRVALIVPGCLLAGFPGQESKVVPADDSLQTHPRKRCGEQERARSSLCRDILPWRCLALVPICSLVVQRFLCGWRGTALRANRRLPGTVRRTGAALGTVSTVPYGRRLNLHIMYDPINV
jgi:hypothetical protein